ncbi:MAG TPA: glycosyl hydrolase 53 family protein [Streptosporangiaceae bacterium]|nr:glycosyl hydrolase 53 family protein [Streptosporangiaceae bacterium]
MRAIPLAFRPAAAPGSRPAPAAPQLPERVRGADLSFTLQLEAAGRTFTDQGRTAPVEQLLVTRGINTVRLRAWVNPPTGYSNLASALTLGRRAHDAGCKILLDLHYSDFWADPSNQTTPAAWRGQDLATLSSTVRTYTRHAVAAFAAQGTQLDMIQIGNEVTSGMLWPTGLVYAGGERWDGFVQLLNAGLSGAREGATAPLRTMVHIDRGADNSGARHFYDNITRRGVDFDLIGLSYYPFWQGPLATLSSNLNDLATRYGKSVMVVETAYPWTLPAGDGVEYYAARPDQLPDIARFPATPAGQAAYFEALRATIEAVPQDRGRGFLVWEPAWLPGVGWGAGEDNPYANLAMFDWRGAGLPSLRVFRADV